MCLSELESFAEGTYACQITPRIATQSSHRRDSDRKTSAEFARNASEARDRFAYSGTDRPEPLSPQLKDEI
jgi:hypothetical protein